MSSRPRPGALERDITQYPWKKTVNRYEPPEIRKALTANFFEPAGSDIMKKTRAMMVYNGLAGAFIGLGHGVYIKNASTFGYGLYYMAAGAFPAAAMGAAYAVGTNVSAKIRKKDDIFNHGIGGLLAGSIMGARLKCPWWGLTWGVGLGIAGMILKYGVLIGWDGHIFYQEGFSKSRGLRFNHFRSLIQNRPHEEGFLPPDY